MKHVKTLNTNTLKDTMKKADAASARLPASLHARLPVQLETRAARTLTADPASVSYAAKPLWSPGL